MGTRVVVLGSAIAGARRLPSGRSEASRWRVRSDWRLTFLHEEHP
jgi:hypothetical protein